MSTTLSAEQLSDKLSAAIAVGFSELLPGQLLTFAPASEVASQYTGHDACVLSITGPGPAS